MKTKLYAAFLFLLFVVVPFLSGRVLGQDQLEWSTTTKIEVRVDGSATWILVREAFLETDYDVAFFQQNYIYASLRNMDKFSNSTRARVNEAGLVTGRNMRAENFEMAAYIYNETVTGSSYGVVKYQFDWIGFAKVEDEKILVGDVFEGRLEDLDRGDTLILGYPSGYVVAFVYPTPDETRKSDQTLMWYGLRNFGAGEPRITIEKMTLNILNILPVIIGIIALVGIGSTGLWFFKFRKKETSVIVQAPQVKLGIEDDEEKVVKLLTQAGGSLYQSTITKQCGFSKSKTSGLLRTMEKRGVIRRQKKGREKVVTLMDEAKEFRGTRKKERASY